MQIQIHGDVLAAAFSASGRAHFAGAFFWVCSLLDDGLPPVFFLFFLIKKETKKSRACEIKAENWPVWLKINQLQHWNMAGHW